jgi:hypothetical protein
MYNSLVLRIADLFPQVQCETELQKRMRAQWLWQRLGSGFARQGGLQLSILRSGKNA